MSVESYTWLINNVEHHRRTEFAVEVICVQHRKKQTAKSHEILNSPYYTSNKRCERKINSKEYCFAPSTTTVPISKDIVFLKNMGNF